MSTKLLCAIIILDMKMNFKMRVISAITAIATVGTVFLSMSFVRAVSPTSTSDTLTREKISTSATHTITGVFASSTWTNASTITFSYSSAGFALGDDTGIGCAITSGGGTCTAASVASTDVVTVTCTTVAGCWGILTLTNVTGTNPGTTGSKQISIAGGAGYTGAFAIPIVDDDQVTVTATVDPTITFDIDTALTDVESAAPYSVALHTLTTAAVTSSGTFVSSTWIDLATNAKGGAVVTVTSTKGGLRSTSVSSDAIDSFGGLMAAGVENYGLCVASASLTQTVGGPFVRVSPFNNTCAADSGTNIIGAVTSTGAQNILNTTNLPIAGGRAQIIVNASISSITPAHNDYTDTLTFIATGTF